MAPSDERPSDQPKRCYPSDDENPFIAFRRFADEAVSSMLQNLIGLPSSFSAPDPRERWIPFDEHARRRTMESWGASPPHDDQKEKDTNQAEEEGVMTPWGRLKPYYGLLPPKEPYKPYEHPPRSGKFYPWDPFDIEFASHENTHQAMREWLRLFLHNSPYSPTYLERSEDLGRYGCAWRMSFEDLLHAQYGKDLKSREERIEAFNRDYYSEWMWDMINKARIWDENETPARSPSNNDTETETEKEFTELDVYERFLQDDHTKIKQPSAPQIIKPSDSDSSSQGLGIISTLTQTERVVLPDGSTTTKVVLKKKFADGREETSETVHNTKRAQETRSASHIEGSHNDTQKDNDKSREKTEQKGWFWN